jgi:hypothetical protein
MIILLDEDRRDNKPKGCCSLWYLYTDELCEHYTSDTGSGILMKDCTNCLFFEDRSLKYRKLYDE